MASQKTGNLMREGERIFEMKRQVLSNLSANFVKSISVHAGVSLNTKSAKTVQATSMEGINGKLQDGHRSTLMI